MKDLQFLLLGFLAVVLNDGVFAQLTQHNLKCISGSKHRSHPSRETNLHACRRYSDSSCCSVETTQMIASDDQKIGNFSWNLCGRLSPSCHKYYRRLECFYQCEPFLGVWSHNARKGGIHRVPICSEFCDSWYEACKDDFTCVKDWLNQYEFDEGWKNKCPRGAECTKFSKLYINGKDMCQTLWGDSLAYSKETCFDVDFEGTNPNWRVVDEVLKMKTKKKNISKSKLKD